MRPPYPIEGDGARARTGRRGHHGYDRLLRAEHVRDEAGGGDGRSSRRRDEGSKGERGGGVPGFAKEIGEATHLPHFPRMTMSKAAGVTASWSSLSASTYATMVVPS